MDSNGLAVEIERGRGAKRTELVWIAAPFEVIGACRDPHGGCWGKTLRWRDDDGRQHVRHVADADLHGEPAALCAGLAHDGLRIDPARNRLLARYLSTLRSKRRVTIVPRTGWHDVGGRSVFVLPGGTIGPRGAERVILDAAAHGAYETRGTIEEWRAGVGALAGEHVLAVLAIEGNSERRPPRRFGRGGAKLGQGAHTLWRVARNATAFGLVDIVRTDGDLLAEAERPTLARRDGVAFEMLAVNVSALLVERNVELTHGAPESGTRLL